MKTKKARIEILADKLLERTITLEEERELNMWYRESLDEPVKIPSDFAESEKVLHQRILNSVQKYTDSKPVVKLWPRIVAAVSIVVCIGIGFYFYHKDHTTPTEIATKNDIAPGGNKAFLTLADGKRIVLTDAKIGELAEQSGVKITKATDGQLVYTVSDLPSQNNKLKDYNTIETPRGGTYQVRLPDGTKVWLNAASTLRFPSSFARLVNRRVELLSGEAYFEVAKDKKHPFIVKTDNHKVKVLGTHFNINAYTDESTIKTTLLEGSVQVTQMGLGIKTLFPGQQSQVSKRGISITKNINLESIIAWRNGDFIFNGEDFKTSMCKIARWYDIEVIYDTSAPSNLILRGEVSRSKSISAVLKIMEATGKVHFKLNGRRLIITK